VECYWWTDNICHIFWELLNVTTLFSAVLGWCLTLIRWCYLVCFFLFKFNWSTSRTIFEFVPNHVTCILELYVNWTNFFVITIKDSIGKVYIGDRCCFTIFTNCLCSHSTFGWVCFCWIRISSICEN
jgi:hypothetical protein